MKQEQDVKRDRNLPVHNHSLPHELLMNHRLTELLGLEGTFEEHLFQPQMKSHSKQVSVEISQHRNSYQISITNAIVVST